MATVNVPAWAQGRTGRGQGGYAAACFESAIGRPLSISLRAPIPLSSDLRVIEVPGGWELRDGETVIMRGEPRTTRWGATEPVTVHAAATARQRFTGHIEHSAPECVSCGIGEKSMRVWAGVLDDGTNRVASDWVPPPWAADDTGVVHKHFVWMALDCTSGFFVSSTSAGRDAVTAQFAAETLTPLRAGETYVTIGFDGNWEGDWDGRKRGAGAAVFTTDGELVAQADSFWIAVA